MPLKNYDFMLSIIIFQILKREMLYPAANSIFIFILWLNCQDYRRGQMDSTKLQFSSVTDQIFFFFLNCVLASKMEVYNNFSIIVVWIKALSDAIFQIIVSVWSKLHLKKIQKAAILLSERGVALKKSSATLKKLKVWLLII